MPGIQPMRERREVAAQKLHAMFPRNENGVLVNGDDPWSEDNQREYDALVREVRDIDDQIKRYEDMIDLIGEQARDATIRADADRRGVSLDEAADKKLKFDAAFGKYLRVGMGAMDADERRILNAAQAQFEVGSNDGGGYSVPDDLRGELLVKMKAFGGMREVSEVMSVSTGRQIEWPTTDPTSEEGEIVTETTAASSSNVEMGQKTMQFDYWTSKIIEVTWEFLQDTAVDINSHITGRLATRIARGQNKAFTIGASSGHVQGFTETATTGITAANSSSQVTDVKVGTLNQVMHSVDPAYRMNGRWMFNDKTLGILERKEDSQNRPLWLPSVQGMAGGATLWGYPYTVNQDMVDMAASKEAIAFGDFSYYKIFDAMDSMVIHRLQGDTRTTKRMVGFLMFMRTSADLISAGDPIKKFKNAAS